MQLEQAILLFRLHLYIKAVLQKLALYIRLSEKTGRTL